MNKICTSIEQSKKLIELGIDVNTADMFWNTAEPNERRKPLVGPVSDYYDKENWAVPAWSLTAFLSVLPFHIVVDNRVYAFGMVKGFNKNGETYAIKYAIFNTTFYLHITDFYIFIEDLCLAGMTRLWGRKVNDLAYGQFVSILEQVSMKYGCVVHKIDRWYASSKMCDCGYKNAKLTLRDRTWVCPVCGRVHDRDIHAAENILRRGIYELSSGSETNEATAEGLPAKAS